MFEEVVARVDRHLDLPYPQRALFLEELEADLYDAYEHLRASGCPEEEARALAARELEPNPEDLAALREIHRPVVTRSLERLSEGTRSFIQQGMVFVPVLTMGAIMESQAGLSDMIREGGAVMLPILFLGIFGLGLLLARSVKWMVLKDHTAEAMRANTPAPLYVAAITVLMGIFATCAGFSNVVRAVVASDPAQQQLIFYVGSRECMLNLMVAAALATLIVMFHALQQAWLRRVRLI